MFMRGAVLRCVLHTAMNKAPQRLFVRMHCCSCTDTTADTTDTATDAADAAADAAADTTADVRADLLPPP